MNTNGERHLFVAWRRPDGLITPVGQLTQQIVDDELCFRFVYLKVAERLEHFVPLPGLPDLHVAYSAPALFPVFANRLMPRDRPDYVQFLEQLDLTTEADPFEVLSRSEGVRATDRIEVFPSPFRTEYGGLETLFFARGIRHLDGAASAVSTLSVGDRLTLEPEPSNEVNSRGMLLNTRTGACVGWAPDYLLDLIHELRQFSDDWPTIAVEHVNTIQAPPHMRLLCRLSAPWPAGYVPFSGPDFQLLAH